MSTTTIALSSYSLREELGPIAAAFTADDGTEHVFRQEFPQRMTIGDFPLRVAARTKATAVEAAAFQFDGPEDPQIDRFATNARRAGLELANAAVDHGNLLGRDPARRAEDVTAMKVWIARFADVGFRRVRVNAGSPFSSDRSSRPPSHLVDALGDLGGYAASVGARLLIENHGGSSSDPAWIAELLGAVGARDLGLLLDTANFDTILMPLMEALRSPAGMEAASLDSLDLTPVYEGIGALAPHAELVHMKAHWATADGVSGPVDMSTVRGILSANGYSGPLTLEYEGQGGDPWTIVGAIIDRLTASVEVSRPS